MRVTPVVSAFRRTVIAAATLAIALGALLSAQVGTPTFRAGTTLVEFTFVALDGRGQPVTDLTKDDIGIMEDGKLRDIAFFRFDGVSPSTAKPLTLPPGQFSNRQEFSSAPPRNITALVIDTVNTRGPADFPYRDQLVLRARLMQYLHSIEEGARVAVYRMGPDGVLVLHDFTDDIESLRASIASGSLEAQLQKSIEPDSLDAISGPGVSPSLAGSGGAAGGAIAEMKRQDQKYWEDVFVRNIDRTTADFEAIGDHLAAIPGRKNLVWVSTGTAMAMQFDHWLRTQEQTLRDVARRLATKGIVFYPWDAKGGTLLERGYWESMDLFAKVTGGRTIKNSDNPTDAMAAAADDLRGSYAVGFYATDDKVSQWHPLKVNVKRPAVVLRHQQGYMSAGAFTAAPVWMETQWRAALANPIGSTAIKLNARMVPVNGADAGTLDLQVRIASNDLSVLSVDGATVAEIEIATAEKVRSGDFSFRVESATLKIPKVTAGEAPPALYARQVRLRPGITSIRLIVRDRRTGRFGVLDVPLEPR